MHISHGFHSQLSFLSKFPYKELLTHTPTDCPTGVSIRIVVNSFIIYIKYWAINFLNTLVAPSTGLAWPTALQRFLRKNLKLLLENSCRTKVLHLWLNKYNFCMFVFVPFPSFPGVISFLYKANRRSMPGIWKEICRLNSLGFADSKEIKK